MNKIQTKKLMISLTTVMTAALLLFACKSPKKDDLSPAAATALSTSGTSSSSSSTNTPATQLVFFATNNGGSGWGSGNLGGRSGADAKCASAKPAGLSCPNGNHALLSFSASDQVSNMPANYGFSDSLPVKAWDGSAINTTVLSQWSGMFSSVCGAVFTTALSAAFNISSGLPYFATGSHCDGSVDSTNNCSGFTSNSGAEIFADVDMGNKTLYPDGGIPAGDCSNFQSNFADAYLICVCY